MEKDKKEKTCLEARALNKNKKGGGRNIKAKDHCCHKKADKNKTLRLTIWDRKYFKRSIPLRKSARGKMNIVKK